MTYAPPGTVAPAEVLTPAQRSARLKSRILAADFVCGAIGVIAAAELWSRTNAGLDQQRVILTGAILALPIFLAHAGLYRSRLITRRASELKRLCEAVALWFVAIVVVGYVAGVPAARGLLMLTAFATFAVLTVEREVVRRIFAHLRRREMIARRAIVIGDDASALDGANNLEIDASGYSVVGLVLTRPGTLPVTLGGRRVLGAIERIFDLVETEDVDTVLIVDGCLDSYVATRLVRQLADLGLHVEVSIAVRDIADTRLAVAERGRYAVAHVMPPIRTGWRMVAKRTFDVVAAAAALTALAPFLLVAAAVIKLDSRGPVLFRQRRVGRDGAEFSMLKLRTMVPDAEARRDELVAANEADGPLFKIENDPRVTRVGRLLRKTSIDELPQLINIIRGDMSLVGPRPALPSEVAGWTPDLFHRLRVRPGLTGLWQIKGRDGTDFESYERYDLYYTDNWSLARDLSIIVRTVPAVIGQRGAR